MDELFFLDCSFELFSAVGHMTAKCVFIRIIKRVELNVWGLALLVSIVALWTHGERGEW